MPAPERIACAPERQQLFDRALERAAPILQQPARQSRLGVSELSLCGALLRAGQLEEGPPRSFELAGLGGPASQGPAAERARQHQRVEQCVALAHVAIEIGQRRYRGEVVSVL